MLDTLKAAEKARVRNARIRYLVEAMGWLITGTAVVAILSSLFSIPPFFRYLLLGGLMCVPVLIGYRFGPMTLFARDLSAVAAHLESADDVLSGKVRTAVDLSRHVPPGSSTDFVSLVLEHSERALGGKDLERLIGAGARIPWRPLVMAGVTVLFLTASSGGSPHSWALNALPWLDPPPPLPQWISFAPGDTSVVKGSSLNIRGLLAHAPSGGVSLVFRRDGLLDQRLSLEPHAAEGNRARYEYGMTAVSHPLRYRFEAPGDSSTWFSIRPFDPLRIHHAEVRYSHPSYTHLPDVIVPGLPTDLRAVEGTEVSLRLRANNELRSCVLNDLSGSAPESLLIHGTDVAWTGILRRSRRFRIDSVDRWEQTASWGPVNVRPEPDLGPELLSLIPGTDGDLDPDLVVDIGMSARDDFGLSSTGIRYVFQEREDTLLFAAGSLGKTGTWERRWAIESLGMLPEDVISYQYYAADNNSLYGPTVSTSDWFHLRFPSLGEIMARIGHDEAGLMDSLASFADDTREISEELRELSVEIAGSGEADWAARESVQDLARRQQELGEKLGTIAEELARMEQRSEDAELLPVELLEKVTQVRQLLETLEMPELKRSLEQLHQALEDVDQRDIERALNRLSSQQEEILKSLDRAVDLLKRLHSEQQLSYMTREAERIAEQQEEITEATRDSNQIMNTLAEQEQELGSNLTSLEQGIQELADSLHSSESPFADSLSSALERERMSGAEDALRRAAQELRAGSRQCALSHEQNALSGLQRLTADLQSLEARMQGQDGREIAEALKRAEDVVAELSLEQEDLGRSDGSESRDQPRQVGIADALRETRRELEEKFAQGIGVPSGSLLQTLASAQNQVDRVVEGGDEKGRKKLCNRALSALNTAAADLATTRQQMEENSSCSGGSSSEQLFGLSQQQGSLNSSARAMLPQAGRLSQEALAAMAARQQWIRDQLNRISQETGSDGMLGDLGAIGQEMEDVVGELENRGLSEKTVEKQRRILSRMLDAQRSLRRQGLARRRRSRSPESRQRMKTVIAPPESPVNGSPGMLPPPRRNDRYPALYREMIEAYFRAIEKGGR